MVYSIGSETNERVCPHNREIQSIDHPAVAAGMSKVTTRALAPKEQSWLLRNIVTKECPHETRKRCQKVKAAQEDTRSQDQRDKSRVWRMTYPNHGVRFDDLLQESVDSYDDLRKAFLKNYLQQKKCIKDPVEIHNIKQRDGESTEEFVWRYKLECRDVKGALECMKISEFMHEITNPELIKRLHDNIPKKAVTSNQRAKAKQWKRSGKGSQKGRNLQKRQATTDTDVISFPSLGEEDGTEGPMIIEAEMGGHCVHHMYVDRGSSSEILYEHCFNRFRPEVKNQMIPAATPLVGFSKGIIWPLGQISLLVKIGDEEHSTSVWMNFMIVRSLSPYNGIIGRPRIKRIQAIPSTAHVILKFPVMGGTVTLRSSKIIPNECTVVSGPGIPQPVIDKVREEKIQVAIYPEYPEQTIAIGSTLTEEGRKELCGLLRRNLDIFAWKPGDMTGVPRHIAEHRLNICEGCLPIRQKKKGQAPERNKAICEEVEKLVDADIMKEVNYHSWLSNSVMGDKDEIKPQKYAFGMREGTFLEYKVDADGLRVCPDKAEAVLNLPSPKCLKDVQKLNEKLASLNRFMSKSAKKSLLFFKTLKKCTKKSNFQWTAKAETTFKQMKRLIAELPMLTEPKEKEDLIMYLAAAKEAISTVLLTERDEKQMPIYFVSRALQGLEVNYTPMEKLILALIKHPEDDALDTPIEDPEALSDPWVLFMDGSSCIDGSGAGLIIMNPKGMEFTYALRFRFNATNNEAEYEALITGPRIAEQMRVKNLTRAFKEFSIKQVPRGEYKKANALSKIASTSFAHLSKQVLVEELKKKSIDEKERTHLNDSNIRIPNERNSPRSKKESKGHPSQSEKVHRPVQRNPQQKLTPIMAPWPFHKWGIDIAGSFLEGLGKVKKFVWDNIVCRFGLSGEITSDNGKQFRDNLFKDWCEKLCIRQCFASVKHPQTNGLVERANLSLGEGIKASNEETPFSLTYGTEAVIPVEVGMPTMRTAEVKMIKNDEALKVNLDLLEEKREQAAIQEAKSKAKM
uniref:Reverse transcriptase domain-containing protein n=1 Tax=Tanacetum cinerariifolium TaxID=118510 RepID=A0A699GZF2_TANCI|nr:reverse transcriptase domain-containing protein [Tanacetum cinerariifolium]